MANVLFVCIENACRSQMAEGIANYLAKGTLKAFSAGSDPAEGVNPDAVKVMQEIGIDISHAHPKGFGLLPLSKFDYVVTLGCKDTCPLIPAEQHIEWQIEDPKGKPVDFFRKVRDQIKERIELLDIDLSKGKNQAG